VQHLGCRQVIYVPGPPLSPTRPSATGPRARKGHVGGEALIPLHKPHARELFSQGTKCIQYPPGLEANLSTHRLWNPDHYLRDSLFADQPPQRIRQTSGRHDLERAGYETLAIRDGDPRAHLSQIEGSDPPAGLLRGGQGLL
jgi:hypothetical protein